MAAGQQECRPLALGASDSETRGFEGFMDLVEVRARGPVQCSAWGCGERLEAACQDSSSMHTHMMHLSSRRKAAKAMGTGPSAQGHAAGQCAQHRQQ